MSVALSVKRLPHGKNIPLPSPATRASSGMDICAALEKPLDLAPMKRALIPTGLCIVPPEGHELQVRPRSGLAWKHGITVLNAPGTIDSDYRGELKVILINLGNATFTIKYGMRIAQLVLVAHMPIRRNIHWKEDEKKILLVSEEKRQGGFGSTGV